MQRIWIITLALLLKSCATEVTSIAANQSKILDPKKGFLLLGIDTNFNLKSILISGEQTVRLTAKDIKKGTNYLLLDLDSGLYKIDKVDLDHRYYLNLDDEDNWQFKITPGAINYIGHFEINELGNWYSYYNRELVNRSSEGLEFMEENYQLILDDYQMIYAGPGEDIFFDHLYQRPIERITK